MALRALHTNLDEDLALSGLLSSGRTALGPGEGFSAWTMAVDHLEVQGIKRIASATGFPSENVRFKSEDCKAIMFLTAQCYLR